MDLSILSWCTVADVGHFGEYLGVACLSKHMLQRSGIAEVKYSVATAVEHVGQDLSNQLD